VLCDQVARRGLRFSLVTIGLLGGAVVPASAETGDVAVAEALFRDGKDLLAQKDYARACPKLAESFRRDPATGTLLALAICHEREGKIGTAWGEYADVASRSKVEARQDRERAARAKASELEPRVSKLTITLSPDSDDAAVLEVRRNGSIVASPLLGTAFPVDGGTQVIEASAPGKKPWRAKVALASTGDKQTVTIPELDDAEDEAPTPKTTPRPVAPRASEPAKSALPRPVAQKSDESEATSTSVLADSPDIGSQNRLTSMQRFGLATGAAGIVGLGAGTFFSYRAVSKNNDSTTGCSGDLCLPKAKQDRLDARTFGNLATIGFIAGGTLTAAGAIMYIVGRPSSRPSASSERISVEAIPVAGPDAVGGMLRGTF
jgi:hypothetical protein